MIGILIDRFRITNDVQIDWNWLIDQDLEIMCISFSIDWFELEIMCRLFDWFRLTNDLQIECLIDLKLKMMCRLIDWLRIRNYVHLIDWYRMTNDVQIDWLI